MHNINYVMESHTKKHFRSSLIIVIFTKNVQRETTLNKRIFKERQLSIIIFHYNIDLPSTWLQKIFFSTKHHEYSFCSPAIGLISRKF